MSGISGIVLPGGTRATATAMRLDRVQDHLRHRGSAAAEVWNGAGVVLGHQRASTTRTPAARQPVSCPRNRCRLVMDAGGGAHRSPEAMAALFADGGVQAVTRLGGAYALAVWEIPERRLTLARDPMGLKPLYYLQAPDGSLAFASEPKALLAAGVVTPALNYRALPYYLANQTSPCDETLFEGVFRVPPGHALTWQDGQISLQPCAHPAALEPEAQAGGGESEVADQFATLFRAAVQRGLDADPAPGALLSGSFGSAAMVGVLHALAGTAIDTFSVTVAGADTDHLEVARLAARAHSAAHRELVLTPEEFFATVPTAVWHQDEPVAHPARIPLYHAMAFASDRVGTVWSAAGCDEVLGGHPRYRQGLTAARVGLVRSKLAQLLPLAATDVRHVYLDSVSVFGPAGQRALLTDEAWERGAGAGVYDRIMRSLGVQNGHRLADDLLTVDLEVWLPEVARTQDRAGMAVSMDTCAPFLDHDLVEFIATVPSRLKRRGRTSHYLLRKALGQHLPAGIRQRDFAPPPIPVGQWLRSSFRPLLHECVLSDLALGRGIMRPDAVGQLVAEHESGRADHTRQLWSLINLEIWQRLYLDGETMARVTPVAAAAV
jgi:asparagine synthase (glutamine-hydrolysing)